MIRPYAAADRDSICSMAEQVIRAGTVFPFESVDGVLEYWFSPGSDCFVADREGLVAGSYVLKPNLPDRCSHIANAGYMVDERCRGQGLGLALGKHSIEWARQAGFRAMQFNIVVASNRAAIRLWERLGFATIGVVPQAFRLDDRTLVDLLIMHRTL